MEFVSVIVAAAAAYAFGAIWYMTMAKPWMAEVGLKPEDIDRSDMKPYIISAISVIVVAGMMRHVFGMAGIEEAGKGLLAGLGLGAFIATPWVFTNGAFAGRSIKLAMIDGTYVVVGCGLMGLVLGYL